MSATPLNKPFKHFESMDLFESAKVSVNAANTSYIQNGEVYEGTPDILWEHTVFIDDIAQIWNRGRYYNSQKYLSKLNAMAKNTFMPWDKTIVTIVEKSYASLANTDIAAVYEDYPGIIPSIIVAPGLVQDISLIHSLQDRGCDVLSTALNGVSVYDSTKTDAQNYDAIQDDMSLSMQWLVEHGIFTNCYKYPDASKASNEALYISKYEEGGLVETASSLNDWTQDNMLLNGITVNSSASLLSAEDILDTNAGQAKWIIFVLDSSSLDASGLTRLVDAIQTYIDSGDAIYLQMHEGMSMRMPEFNIGRGTSLPFRVYKNGEVDFNASASTVASLANKMHVPTADNIPGYGLTYNSATGKVDLGYTVSDTLDNDAYLPTVLAIKNANEADVNNIEFDSTYNLTYTNNTGTSYTIVSASDIVTYGGGIKEHQSVVLASGTNNGTLKLTVNGNETDNVEVTGLGAYAFVDSISKTDVGLDNVTNDAQVKRSEMGTASGVATLGADGLIPASQLPSYVDDVIELLDITDTAPSECTSGDKYFNTEDKKIYTATGTNTWGATGEDPVKGKIYVNLSNEKTFRWSGSAMVEISPTIGPVVEDGTQDLAWNTSIVLGTVNGTEITGKLPANPVPALNVVHSAEAASANNIVTFSAAATASGTASIKDSGKAFSTAAPASASTDNQIPTSKAVWTTVSSLAGYGLTYNTTTNKYDFAYTVYDSIDNDKSHVPNTYAVNQALSLKADTFTVEDGTADLSWGTSIILGTVAGTNITGKLPANPVPALNVIHSAAATTSNNIVTFSANGTASGTASINDSGKAFSTAAPAASSTDNQIPTSKAVWTMASGMAGYGLSYNTSTKKIDLGYTVTDTLDDDGKTYLPTTYAVNLVFKTVTEAIDELDGRVDGMTSDAIKQEFMYYMAANLMSYWNSQGIRFMLLD